jgi:hypothetical protein
MSFDIPTLIDAAGGEMVGKIRLQKDGLFTGSTRCEEWVSVRLPSLWPLL